MPAHRWAATEIPRDAILSITAGTGRRYRGDTGPVTQIAYQPAGPSSTTPATVLLGPTGSRNTVWLTVEQADLLAALQTWHNSDPRDPGPARPRRGGAARRAARRHRRVVHGPH